MECTSPIPGETLLVCNIGALTGLLFKSDFFDYIKCSISVHNFSKVNEIIGTGSTIHKFVDTKG